MSNNYIAKFSMYSDQELQVFFTVEGINAQALIANMGDLGNELVNRGYSVQHPSLNQSEKLEDISGWVLSRTKKKADGKGGDPCVHLYSTHPGRQFKIATVWNEQIDSLPFADDLKGVPAEKGAPEKDQAIIDEVFHRLPDGFQIVISPTDRTSDSGNVIYRYERVVGYNPPKTAGAIEDSNGNGNQTNGATQGSEPVKPLPFNTSTQAAKWAFDAGYFATFPSAEAFVDDAWSDRPVSLRVLPVTDEVQRLFLAHLLENFKTRSKVDPAPEPQDDIPF